MSLSLIKSVLFFFGLLAIGLLVGLAAHGQETLQKNESRLDQSRAVAKSFGSQLQSELLTAMKQGGPINAIDVCRVQAPQIAEKLSNDSGAMVSRTSLKTRNPGNAPSPWQQQVLRSYEIDQHQNRLFAERYEESSSGEARYMQAITMKPLCLACHGKTLSPDVEAALTTVYPMDQAVGYAIDEVRGAFSVVWPPSDLSPQNSNSVTSTQTVSQKSNVALKETDTMTVLSEPEVHALNEALDDEYKSMTIYEQVISDFGSVRPFSNISTAESRHINALKRVFNTYNVTPATNPYVGKVPRYSNILEACTAAVKAEVDNATLYDRIMKSTQRSDILAVFKKLRDASQERHLVAFERCVQRSGD